MADDQPKIIVDEDWKEKVKREKAAAVTAAPELASDPNEDSAPVPETQEDAEEQGKQPTPFQALVQYLAAQGLMTLGVIAPRDSKEVYVDLDGAEYFISTLTMLREKTEGNLTPEETGTLREVLAELQRLYALRVQEYHEHMMQQAAQGQPKPL